MAYTVEEAGDLLSLSRAQLYRLIDCGDLETIKIGKSRRVTSRQLDAFLAGHEAQNGYVPQMPAMPRRAQSRRKSHV
jgi:excisionase family DNA binding protein